MKRRCFFRKSLFVLGSLGVLGGGSAAFAAGWKVDEKLPNLATFGLEGSLPELKGKVVYLDFWASWCAPCKASFPVLSKWQQEFSAKGFTVLAVSVDTTSSEMAAFLKKYGVGFPVVRDAGQQLVAAADVCSMPTAFLIDRKGQIRVVHNGFREKDEELLAGQIKALLAER